MKKYTILILLFLMITGCYAPQKNGWYYIANGQIQETGREPILTISDIDEIELGTIQVSAAKNTSQPLIHLITITLKQGKGNVLLSAVKGYKEKKVGFVYKGEILETYDLNNPGVKKLFESDAKEIPIAESTDSIKIRRMYEFLKNR